MEHIDYHQMLLLFGCLLLLVNLGLNIALLVKKKNTSEDYKVLSKMSDTSSPIHELVKFVPVVEFDQMANMKDEIINFTIDLENQNINKYFGAYIRFEGLKVPFSIVLLKQMVDIIDSETYKKYYSTDIGYPIIQEGENKYTIIYKNNNKGEITIIIKFGDKKIYEKTISNDIGLEPMKKKITVSAGSYQRTKWEF